MITTKTRSSKKKDNHVDVEDQWIRIYSSNQKPKGAYLMFSNRVTTCTATKALWMEKCPHASQIIPVPNFTFATSTYSANHGQKKKA